MKTVIVKEVMDANSITTIIDNLNTLYSGAMSQLITYTAIIIGVVGLLIPAISIIFQWRSLKSEKESLERNIQDGINNAKVTIRNDLIMEMREQIKIEETKLTSLMEAKFKELEKQIDCATASTFFLQAGANFNAKSYADAIVDYSIASKRFLQGDDELNGQTALSAIIGECLPKINKTEYENKEIDKSIKELTQYLESADVNVNDRYTKRIQDLKNESKKAKVREAVNAQ
jgi:hypothetical protein